MKKTRSFVMSRENWILEALEKAGEVFKRNALVPLLPHPFPLLLRLLCQRDNKEKWNFVQ